MKALVYFLFIVFVSTFVGCSSQEPKAKDGEFSVVSSSGTPDEEKEKEGESEENTSPETAAKGESGEEGAEAKATDEKDKKGKKKAKKAKKEAPKPEPGTIWSKASYWNRMFSKKGQRSEGDVILIKPTESLRQKIASLLAKKDKKKSKEAPAFMDRTIAATLRKVDHTGNYEFYASPALFMGEKTQVVELNGKVREKEINSKDEVLGDFLHEVALVLPKKDKDKKDKKGEGEEELEDSKSAKGKKQGLRGVPTAAATENGETVQRNVKAEKADSTSSSDADEGNDDEKAS